MNIIAKKNYEKLMQGNSDYLKSRTRTLSEIKEERAPFSLHDFVYVLNSQDSFLELSKYLLSDIPYTWVIGNIQEHRFFHFKKHTC